MADLGHQQGGIYAFAMPRGGAVPEMGDSLQPGFLRHAGVLLVKGFVQAEIAQTKEEVPFAFVQQVEEALLPEVRFAVGQAIGAEAAESGRQGCGIDVSLPAGGPAPAFAGSDDIAAAREAALRKGVLEIRAQRQQVGKFRVESPFRVLRASKRGKCDLSPFERRPHPRLYGPVEFRIDVEEPYDEEHDKKETQDLNHGSTSCAGYPSLK